MKTNEEKWRKAVEIASHSKGVDPVLILGRSRISHIAIARHLARWIACECMRLPRGYVEKASLARHRTASWSIRQINNFRDVYPWMKETTEQIKKSIANENEIQSQGN